MSRFHRSRFYRIAPVLALASVAVTACPKRRPPAAGPAPVNQDSLARERARQDSLAALDRQRQDSLARAQAMADSMRASLGAARTTLTTAIHFDFDRDDLTDEARSILDAKVPVLTGNTAVRIRIAGHTDNRGSDEYNLALGQRRAATAKRYLTQHGIDASRVDITSFGEEQPVAQGDDESAWAQNRRDEFEIIAGGDNLAAPQSQ